MTTVNTNIKIGDRVRSFDFPHRTRDLEGPNAHYVEGKVTNILMLWGCDHYIITVDRVVIQGNEEPVNGMIVKVPVNGTQIWGDEDDLTNGVELI